MKERLLFIVLFSLYPKKHIDASYSPFPWVGSTPVPRGDAHIQLWRNMPNLRAGPWSLPSSLLGTARCAHPTLPFSTGTSSILVGEVGKAPDVPQAHGVAHHGQQVVAFARPVPTLRVLIAVTGLWIFFMCQIEVLRREEGRLVITHQAREAIISSFLCPETYLNTVEQLDRASYASWAPNPPDPWQDSTDLWERVPPESPNTSTDSFALVLCQLRGAARGHSPILPLHMLHTCSDVHISTYLYTRFKKHLS